MAYRVELPSGPVILQKPQFLTLVTRLSYRLSVQKRHQGTAFPAYPSTKAAFSLLFALVKPMFRVWAVAGSREDYEQTAYLCFHRAVLAWDPKRGAFLAYLKRFTVGTALRDHAKTRPIPSAGLVEWDMPGEAEEPDYLLWSRVRASLSPLDYRLMALRVLEGLTLGEIAKRIGMRERELRLHYDALYARCRDIWREGEGMPRKGWGEDPDAGPIFPPSPPKSPPRNPPLPI